MPTKKYSKIDEKLGQIHREQEEQEAARLAQHYKLPYLNLQFMPIDTEALSILPQTEAEAAGLVILKKNNKNITVGMTDPGNEDSLAAVGHLTKTGYTVTESVISVASLKRALSFYQGNVKETPLVGKIRISQESLQQFSQKIDELKNTLGSISTTEILEMIIAGAFQSEAGDIHIEPASKDVRLRYRIDGVLQDIAMIPNRSWHSLLTRIKILSDMKINVHDSSQDGRFTIQITQNFPTKKELTIIKEMEARVSILPEAENETVVIRLLGSGMQKLSVENLGIDKTRLDAIKHAIKRPNGLILNTGPTGSGKTTTLYAFLNYLNDSKVKIITIEDPVEYKLPGIVQTQVSQKENTQTTGQQQQQTVLTREKYNFAQALRAILRQNPNIIMVGEIRDEETAKTAIQASLTGHMVISTLHANDATASVQRLFNFGINPGDLALAMNFFMAQRLVRRLCPKCKQAIKLENKTLELIKKNLQNLPDIEKKLEKAEFFKPGTCDECKGLGYRGQAAIYEIFFKNEKVEELIAKNTQTLEIEKAAKAAGMITLRQDGLLKAIEGITSIEEIQRVTGELSENEL